MPVEEFARLFYAMSRVLEEPTDKLGVSKRAGIVLWLLHHESEGCMENRELVKKFGAWHLSKTHEGAARDVSKANEELEKKHWITLHRGPYRVCVTDDGRKAAAILLNGFELALARIAILPEQRNLLKSLVLGDQARKLPQAEGSSSRPGEEAKAN